MDNLISVRNLTKNYGDFSLRDVNLTVPAGAVVGLVGENGAGKTTLLRAILGMIRADGGQIELMGGAPEDPAHRRRVAAVFEDSFFYGGLNARQIGRVMKGTIVEWDGGRYDELLKAFGLPLSKPVKEFSKGMQMKINLATALARRPRLLILDEPTSGLDPVMRGELLDILLEFMQDEHNSLLISSHITADLEKIADQIAYIHTGRLLFQRDKLELLEDMAVLRCPMAQIDSLPAELVIAKKSSVIGSAALVKEPERVRKLLPGAVVDAASIDEMMQFYSGRDEA